MDVKFLNMIFDLVSICAFYNKTCMMIASLALKTFHTKFMKKNTVGIIPALGYRDCIDLVANFYSKLTGWGEKKINSHYVDGYNPDKKCVYQFHGSTKCFNLNEYN